MFRPSICLQARTGKLKARALRHLAAEQLGLTIQEGEHSPVDDARASLYLYLKHRKVGGAAVASAAHAGVRASMQVHTLQASCTSCVRVCCLTGSVLQFTCCLSVGVNFMPQEWERWVQQGGKPHQHPAVAQMTAVAMAVSAGGRGPAGQSAGGAAGIQLSLAELAKNDYMADL